MIDLTDCGSLVLIDADEADRDAFEGWIAEHTEGALRWGGAVVVEPRYVNDLIAGLEDDGFEVEVP